jgi:branched-subunit amino acid transport protein
MTDFSSNIILVIAVTSIATYLSRSLGVLFSERIDENSKIFRLFDCIAYSTLAALISKVVVFPAGDLGEASSITRLIVVFVCVAIFLLAKRNLVYPTVLSAILLTVLIKYI